MSRFAESNTAIWAAKIESKKTGKPLFVVKESDAYVIKQDKPADGVWIEVNGDKTEPWIGLSKD